MEERQNSRIKYKFSNIPGIEALNSGPDLSSRRPCTDICCGIFFLLALTYFIILGCSALFLGDVNLIGAPYDPDQRACGVDEDAIDYPYIYYTTPIVDTSGNFLYRTVCLKECPDNITANVYGVSLECLVNSQVTACTFKSSPESDSFLLYNTVSCKEDFILFFIGF